MLNFALAPSTLAAGAQQDATLRMTNSHPSPIQNLCLRLKSPVGWSGLKILGSISLHGLYIGANHSLDQAIRLRLSAGRHTLRLCDISYCVDRQVVRLADQDIPVTGRSPAVPSRARQAAPAGETSGGMGSPDRRHASPPVPLFYVYAHADEPLRDELAKHLALLQRQGVISGWHDRMIQAGEVWEPTLRTHLETAGIILLLVSADLLASEYCWGQEVARALERQRAGTARVIPILLRDVDWSLAPFHTLQALPRDARPVTSWPNQDEAFAHIARGIRQVALALRGGC